MIGAKSTGPLDLNVNSRMWTLECELSNVNWDRSKRVWTLSQSELRSIQLGSISSRDGFGAPAILSQLMAGGTDIAIVRITQSESYRCIFSRWIY